MKKFISGIYIESSYKNLGFGKLPTFLEMKLSSDHEEVNSKFYTIDRITRNIKNESLYLKNAMTSLLFRRWTRCLTKK